MKATTLAIVVGLVIFGGILPITAQDNDTGTKTPKADGKPTRMPAESRHLDVVLDLQRPSNTDILLLRNGGKLTGTILNDSFSVRTSYARMKFVNRVIAGVDLDGGANNIESIITVNNNRFSGFIDDPAFTFKLQSGTQIKIRREKVLKAVFRVRKAERKGIPQNQFVVLKNGENILVGYSGVSHHMGLRLTKIDKDSPAQRAGLRTGDIVYSVDGLKMSDDGAVFIEHRNEIIQGKRDHANIVIFRGKEWLIYRLVK